MIDGIQARNSKALSTLPAIMAPKDERDAALKKSASQLEGMFVQQLYKAMRESVPQQEGIVSGGAGEDIFTGLLDQHLAAETPQQWDRGIAQALYRQLRQGSPIDATPASGPTPDSSNR